MQLAIANQEKERLLQALLDEHKPQIPEKIINETAKQPIAFRGVPWAVRRQMLEAEDREKAKILKNKVVEQAKLAPENDTDQKRIEELEKELGIEGAS